MVNAIKAEIDKLKKTKHEIVLFDGLLIKQVDNWFIYRFEIPEGTYLRVVEDVEIYIAGEDDRVKGDLVSVENQFANIRLSEDKGKKVARLTIVWHSDAILRKMLERLTSISSDPAKFSIATSDQLFYPVITSNIMGWKEGLILPQKTYIADPPKDLVVNQEQRESLKKALQNKVTFIWGPPGTGKTQTLGMVAYNLIKGERKVLLASNTNRAVDNAILSVIDRYKDHGGNFVQELTRYGQIALFNNEELQQVSFEKQTEFLRQEKLKKVRKKLELLKRYKEVKRAFAVFDEQVRKVNELDRAVTQKSSNLNTVLLQLKTLRSQIDDFDKAGIIELLKRKFTGITKESLQSKFVKLQEQGRELKISIDSIQQDRESVEKGSAGLVELRQEFQELKTYVDRFGGEASLSEEIEKELQIDEGALLRDKKLTAATLAKIVMNDVFWHLRYDVLLIDEASMVCLPYLAALSALSTEKVIIIGDPQQLPPISLCEDTECKRWLQRDIYMFAGCCSCTEELFQWNEKNPDFTVFLKTQYRMASDMCSVISSFFYNGKLSNGLDPDKSNGQIVFIDSSPLHAVTKKLEGKKFKPYNVIHTEKIIDLIKTAVSVNHYGTCDIGIIVPFNGSVQYVREQLRLQNLKSVEVGTVHTFQGREKDVIIFDTVMAGVDFTVRPFDETKTSEDEVRRLLNVALSRAKKDIFNIANMDHFRNFYRGRFIYRLLQELNNRSTNLELNIGTATFDEMTEDEKIRLLGLDDVSNSNASNKNNT